MWDARRDTVRLLPFVIMRGGGGLNSSFGVFARRVRSDWHFQYRAMRMAVDWVIAIYFVIPLLIIAGYHYYVWLSAPPARLSEIPIQFVSVLFYVFTWLGTLRFFVEEGDQLFLRQNEIWFRSLMRLGYRYSVVLQGITSLALVLLFLPLLSAVYGYSVSQIVCLWVLTYVVKLNIGVIRQLLALRLRGILLWLVRIVLFIGLALLFQAAVMELADQPLYGCSAIVVGIVTFDLLTRVRLREKGAFFADIARERDARMRLVSLMLVRIVERKRKPTRKYPLIFSRSQRLFKGAGASQGLAELLAKSYFRSGLQWRLSLQFTVVISGLMFVLPGAVKIFIWILAAVILVFWRKSFCKDELTTPFLTLFPIEDTKKHQALQKVMPALVLPAFIVISLCAGISLFTWWGPIVMVSMAIPVAYGSSSVFTSWY
ncbi:ABC transporter permease [Paenibacillus roseipurpureus]|uniref:ABC transporter permease n=1 Tax=Paenibacillus roseopurpureus TaxID=2918901 RepID=A0AA96LPA5_9BACL|nr:ABC transporter permease [Paenibacillus sp. MBLB1832]WNR45450.1 ABC transporter permease [Paenibacillus sp. MBLB1832]